MHITKPLLGALLLTLATQADVHGASCGTMASPTTCSVLLGGNTLFTASNFNLAVAAGTTQYQESDILIDIASGGGGSVVLTFSKNANGPTPGIVFLANPGEIANFSFSYDAQLTPNLPGTVAFTGARVEMTHSLSGNGNPAVQLSISGMPTPCQAIAINPGVNCSLPPSPGSFLDAGDIVALSGNSGNTSILNFRNIYQTSFTPDSNPVPEPSSFALLGLGLGGFAWMRSRQRER